MGRLLILACSQRKKAASGLLPAINRYDGPLYFVLRKYLRGDPAVVPNVIILSAKYGLISADKKIPNYDCLLTEKRAERLRPRILTDLTKIASDYSDVLVCAGSAYRRLILGVKDEIGIDQEWTVAPGGQGPKLSCLYRWLRGDQKAKGEKGMRNGN